MNSATGELILIVEDERNIQQGIRSILELADYRVVSANDGLEALELLRKSPKLPDLILSDIMMPRMDGFGLLNEVRTVPEWVRLPFIFLTAFSDREILTRAKAMGVDDYVVKPFDANELLIAVRSRLDRMRQINDLHTSDIHEVKHSILTIINHELRTPLTLLTSYAHLLNETPPIGGAQDEDIVDYLRGMTKGAERLRRLLENFIHLVELETGSAQRAYALEREIISDVGRLFQDATNAVAPMHAKHLPNFAHRLPDVLPAFTGGARLLTLALGELIDNAIKFSPPGTTVTLGAHQRGDMLYLWVHDQGRGIPNVELSKVWEPFYQIDRQRREDQGSGAGLAIVRGIAGLHGGTAGVESVENRGSTFYIALPLTTELPDDTSV